MTKREKFDVINTVFASLENEYKDEIMEFCSEEIAAIDRKNEKARDRAKAKREMLDALTEQIEGILTNEPMTINDILVTIGDEGLTPAKIVSRMSKLVKSEKAVKNTLHVEGRKLVAYSKPEVTE